MEKELKVLVITLQNGLRRELRAMMDGKTIRLNFSDEKDVGKIPRKVLRAHDAFCIATHLESSGTTACIHSFRDSIDKVKKSKAKKKKKTVKKRKPSKV